MSTLIEGRAVEIGYARLMMAEHVVLGTLLALLTSYLVSWSR